MTTPRGYKQTEVGVIPEDWEIKRLGDVADIRSGGTPSTSDSAAWNGEIPWCTPTDITALKNGKYLYTTERSISEHGLNNSSAEWIASGSILMTSRATIGSCAINAIPVTTNQGFKNFIPFDRVDTEFLYYSLCTQTLGLIELASGSTFLEIGKTQLKEYKIKIPADKAEQTAIAEVLSDTDSLLNSLQRLIDKKQGVKQATMQQLLSGQTRLPGFDGEWQVRRLGDLADISKGNGLSKSSLSVSGSNPCVLYGELFTHYARVIDTVSSHTQGNEGTLSQVGDILMPASTTTKGIDLATASALMLGNILIGGDINIIRAKGDVFCSVFMANYITYIKRHEIAEMSQGITIHHIYGRHISALEVCIPSKQEQTAIAQMLSDMDEEITALHKRLDKTRQLKQALMQELLSGSTRLVTPA